MKYINNSSFQEIFKELIDDANVSFNDEINIKNALSDHESELEYQCESEMKKSFDFVLGEISEGVDKARVYVSDLVHEIEQGDFDDKDMPNILENIRVMLCEIST